MQNDLIARFESRWRFARILTRDLLQCLEASDLTFSPGKHVGPVWKQFRHLGRVQENYLDAIETGKIVFGFYGASYAGEASKKQLLEYLARLDGSLTEWLTTLDVNRKIDWFGDRVDVYEHLARLADHEILHHGMFIVHMRLLGRSFPSSWAAWGV